MWPCWSEYLHQLDPQTDAADNRRDAFFTRMSCWEMCVFVFSLQTDCICHPWSWLALCQLIDSACLLYAVIALHSGFPISYWGCFHFAKCRWVKRETVRLLIPPSHIHILSAGLESLWVCEPIVRRVSQSCRIGHAGWVCKGGCFLWMPLTACRFRTPAPWKRETESRDILQGKRLCRVF